MYLPSIIYIGSWGASSAAAVSAGDLQTFVTTLLTTHWESRFTVASVLQGTAFD